jgi:methanogenic corrinoid protein MtbC1
MAVPHETFPTDLPAICSAYLAAQLVGNRRAALSVIDQALDLGVSPVDLQLSVIQEAQRRIGQLWQEDRITIAQEHMATAISQVALARVYQSAKASPPNGKKVVVACVNGELHDFPARLVSDALDLAGYETRFLGADVPTSSLLEVIAKEQPDLVALSVTMTFNVLSLKTAVEEIRRATAGQIRIVVGGHALVNRPNYATEIGANATARDARELVTAARQLLGGPA